MFNGHRLLGVARRLIGDLRRRPFGQLYATFVTHLMLGDSSASVTDTPRRLFWVVALLVPPGIFLLMALLPEFEAAVLGTRAGIVPPGYVDDLMAWIVLLFTTYAMGTTGLVAVLAWEGLTFQRSDWMVLGTLPIRRPVILGAKLAALASLLLVCALPVNVLNGFVFASVTANHEPAGVWFRHFDSFVVSTAGASTLAFVGVLFARGMLTLAAGPRVASACAVPLQGLSVAALCSLLVFCPFVLDVPYATATFTNWLPSSWFVGVFELLRGSPRAFDPVFPFELGAIRAASVTLPLLVASVVLAVLQGHRQMRESLAPGGRSVVFESVPIARRIARLAAFGDPQVRALAEFSVATIARNRPARSRLAVTSALALVLVTAGLASGTDEVAALMAPRADVLWIPLVVAFWTAVGARAALRVAIQPPALWMFASVPTTPGGRARAATAVVAAFVLPRTCVATAALVPLIGWRLAADHTALVLALTVLLVHLAGRRIDELPFKGRPTTAEATLKGRWALYFVGLYFFARFPASVAVSIGSLQTTLWFVVPVAAVVAAATLVERYRSAPRLDGIAETDEEGEQPIVLRLDHLDRRVGL